jgi:hypothetical protein
MQHCDPVGYAAIKAVQAALASVSVGTSRRAVARTLIMSSLLLSVAPALVMIFYRSFIAGFADASALLHYMRVMVQLRQLVDTAGLAVLQLKTTGASDALAAAARAVAFFATSFSLPLSPAAAIGASRSSLIADTQFVFGVTDSPALFPTLDTLLEVADEDVQTAGHSELLTSLLELQISEPVLDLLTQLQADVTHVDTGFAPALLQFASDAAFLSACAAVVTSDALFPSVSADFIMVAGPTPLPLNLLTSPVTAWAASAPDFPALLANAQNAVSPACSDDALLAQRLHRLLVVGPQLVVALDAAAVDAAALSATCLPLISLPVAAASCVVVYALIAVLQRASFMRVSLGLARGIDTALFSAAIAPSACLAELTAPELDTGSVLAAVSVASETRALAHSSVSGSPSRGLDAPTPSSPEFFAAGAASGELAAVRALWPTSFSSSSSSSSSPSSSDDHGDGDGGLLQPSQVDSDTPRTPSTVTPHPPSMLSSLPAAVAAVGMVSRQSSLISIASSLPFDVSSSAPDDPDPPPALASQQPARSRLRSQPASLGSAADFDHPASTILGLDLGLDLDLDLDSEATDSHTSSTYTSFSFSAPGFNALPAVPSPISSATGSGPSTERQGGGLAPAPVAATLADNLPSLLSPMVRSGTKSTVSLHSSLSRSVTELPLVSAGSPFARLFARMFGGDPIQRSVAFATSLPVLVICLLAVASFTLLSHQAQTSLVIVHLFSHWPDVAIYPTAAAHALAASAVALHAHLPLPDDPTQPQSSFTFAFYPITTSPAVYAAAVDNMTTRFLHSVDALAEAANADPDALADTLLVFEASSCSRDALGLDAMCPPELAAGTFAFQARAEAFWPLVSAVTAVLDAQPAVPSVSTLAADALLLTPAPAAVGIAVPNTLVPSLSARIPSSLPVAHPSFESISLLHTDMRAGSSQLLDALFSDLAAVESATAVLTLVVVSALLASALGGVGLLLMVSVRLLNDLIAAHSLVGRLQITAGGRRYASIT